MKSSAASFSPVTFQFPAPTQVIVNTILPDTFLEYCDLLPNTRTINSSAACRLAKLRAARGPNGTSTPEEDALAGDAFVYDQLVQMAVRVYNTRLYAPANTVQLTPKAFQKSRFDQFTRAGAGRGGVAVLQCGARGERSSAAPLLTVLEPLATATRAHSSCARVPLKGRPHA
jgi:hypothetical protein